MTSPYIHTPAEQLRLLKLSHKIASEAHKGQKRKDGKAYITHPEAVAAIVDEYFLDFILFEAQSNLIPLKNYALMAAFLHDTIEDTYVTTFRLRNEGIPEIVVDAVFILSKRPGETYFDFTMRVRESGNYLAIIVKLADLRHNMSDLKEGSQKDKYRFAEYLLLPRK